MPLVGVVLPGHKDLESNIEGTPPRWVAPDELLQMARLEGPKWSPYTYELLAAALAEHQERDYISVTMLVGGCPRSKVLERREKYVLTAQSFYPALRGTMVHRTLESHARPSSRAEERFHATVSGMSVSCSPDIVTADGDLYDYKVTENPPTFGYPWRNHTLQVMYNAFLARQSGVYVRSGSLVYLGPKGPKVITVERKQPFITAKGTKVLRNQPYVWTDEEVLQGHGLEERGNTASHNSYHKDEPGLIERLHIMTDALESYPKFQPAYAETWGGPNLTWKCPGPPWCNFPNCLAKRWPHGLVW